MQVAQHKLALQQQPNATVVTANHPALHGEQIPLRAQVVQVDRLTGVTTHATAQHGIQPLSMVEPDLVLAELPLLVAVVAKAARLALMQLGRDWLATPTPSLARQRRMAVAVAVVAGVPLVVRAEQAVVALVATTLLVQAEPQTQAAVAAVAVLVVRSVALAALVS